MPLFFVIVFGLWAALHAYVAQRLIGPLAVSRGVRIALRLLVVPLWLLSPSAFFMDSVLTWPYDIAYRWLAWTYMGGFTVLFALLVFRDVAMLGLRALASFGLRGIVASTAPSSPERRAFLLKATNGAALGATGVLTGLGVREARRVPEVVEVVVPIKDLPPAFDGYHIVQLSDVHVGLTIDKDFLLPIIEAVTSLSPDLLALTGDLVDGSVDKLHDDISPFGYLRARDGMLCVTGNHEYYSGVEEWCTHFRELGLSVLNNSHVLIERGGARMLVAGVTDYREGKRHPAHRSDPKAALAKAPAHDFRILLAHQPKSTRDAKDLGFKLQLSGHTHGGQFFPWNLFVGLIEPFRTGLTRVHDDMWIYVSRGTCYWGPPLRTGVPPEITSLRLKRA